MMGRINNGEGDCRSFSGYGDAQDEPVYGYNLVEKLALKGVPVEANTLYPLLRRLSSQGLLDNRWDTSTSKPRKYYVITEKGKQVRGDLKNQWKKMAEAVDRMM